MPFGIQEVIGKQSVEYVDGNGIIRRGVEVVVKEGHITSPDIFLRILVIETSDPEDLVEIDTSRIKSDKKITVRTKDRGETSYFVD